MNFFYQNISLICRNLADIPLQHEPKQVLVCSADDLHGVISMCHDFMKNKIHLLRQKRSFNIIFPGKCCPIWQRKLSTRTMQLSSSLGVHCSHKHAHMYARTRPYPPHREIGRRPYGPLSLNYVRKLAFAKQYYSSNEILVDADFPHHMSKPLEPDSIESLFKVGLWQSPLRVWRCLSIRMRLLKICSTVLLSALKSPSAGDLS